MSNYEERLKISIKGSNEIKLFSKSKVNISVGYNRIIIGKRGPYIEFEFKNFTKDSGIIIPEKEKWRLNSKSVYYIEYRILPDSDFLKVYFQKRVVDYADYKIGKYYVSPFGLFLEKEEQIIEEILYQKGDKSGRS